MDYHQTLEWMFQQLPMYQRQGKTAFKKDLTNIINFSEELKRPETKFKSIHVAGTNGKGSTSHMLASILQEAGFRVGLYTSPHLRDFRERIKINGKEIPEAFVVDFISNHKSFLQKHQLSFFEMSVGMAFQYFAVEKVDIVVVEVGLGGRLDSTNIIIPELSVITNIGLDHTQFLGTTYAEIAAEKAGIIKKGIPVVIGESHPETIDVFTDIALAKEAPIFFAEKNQFKEKKSDLTGTYQKKNIQTVLQAIEVLGQRGWKISEENIRNGLLSVKANTDLKGRWQELKSSPKVICDTAHNKEGLTYVLQQLLAEVFEKLHIVLGVVNDKDLNGILPLFPQNAVYYFCKPDIPRGMSEELLMNIAEKFGLQGKAFLSVKEAYDAANESATEKDLIFVGGSTFVVAEII